jgi:TRAP transporter 4TM/12TM fusion protein
VLFLAAMLALCLVLIGGGSRRTAPPWGDLVAAALALAAGGYFAYNGDAIMARMALFDPLSAWDVAAGTIFLVLSLEVARRTVGPPLTLIVVAIMAYNLLGDRLSGNFAHGPIDYFHLLDLLVFTGQGLFGNPIQVAATYAFLFVAFGTLLTQIGGAEIFFHLANAVVGKRVGGPAKVAILSSALFGTISGSPTADVVATGSITIPLMKRVGLPAALAGGIEVTASTGGGIMPPVMGAAAFLMAEFTGIPYGEIALAALLPSLLYFLGIYAQVHLRSMALGLTGAGLVDPMPVGALLRRDGIFLLPLLAMIAAMSFGLSATRVAAFSALAVVGVAMVRPGLPRAFGAIYEGLAETTVLMLRVTGACAAAGLVIGSLAMTGLDSKLSHLLFAVAGDSVGLALVVAALIPILLGMGMPTSGVYILGAALVAPVLIVLGASVLAAHMFVLYFACLSAITPPVAVAAFAAAAIAEANPFQVAFAAVRLTLSAFVVPFAFILRPDILLIGDPLNILTGSATACAGVLCIALGVEGFWRTRIDRWTRALLIVAGIALILPWTLLSLTGAALATGAAFASPSLRSNLVSAVRAWAPVVKAWRPRR